MRTHGRMPCVDTDTLQLAFDLKSANTNSPTPSDAWGVHRKARDTRWKKKGAKTNTSGPANCDATIASARRRLRRYVFAEVRAYAALPRRASCLHASIHPPASPKKENHKHTHTHAHNLCRPRTPSLPMQPMSMLGEWFSVSRISTRSTLPLPFHRSDFLHVNVFRPYKNPANTPAFIEASIHRIHSFSPCLKNPSVCFWVVLFFFFTSLNRQQPR